MANHSGGQVFLPRVALLAFLTFFTLLARFAFLPAAQADEREDASLDCLVLNDGGALSLKIDNRESAGLYINGGVALRVPRKLRIPDDIGKKIIELDISTRTLSVATSAKQITLSGPNAASISGIDAQYWGTEESPALNMDRDCSLVLLGKADSSAVIRVNPLARVTIDARKFRTPEIKIMGNPSANVFAMRGTNVSFHDDSVKKRIVIMRGWYGGTPASTPSSPPAPPTPPGIQVAPQGTLPPPPGTPALQTQQSPPPAAPPAPSIPGVTQTL